jgi:hypothetical protein
VLQVLLNALLTAHRGALGMRPESRWLVCRGVDRYLLRVRACIRNPTHVFV